MLGKRLLLVGFIASASYVAIACGSSGDESGFGSSGGASSGTSGGASGSGGFGSSGTSGGIDAGQQQDECKKMDIVFVVDNSGSMKEEQDNLAANFPKFVQVINDYKTKSGESLEYRVAVTTSDDGAEKGKFMVGRGDGAPNGCAAGPTRPWLERTDGDVAGFFGCRARVGVDGSSVERVINSALLSVTARITDGSNTSQGQSFVRDDALLAMVLITDEDEGGAEAQFKLARPIAEYAPAFDGVKSDRARWAAAAIAGPGPGKCTSAFGDAAEAKRVKEFISSVGKNATFASICDGDMTGALTKALDTFSQACRDFPAGPVK